MDKISQINDLYPDFLIVGAGKSGTSSLHRYLNEHPLLFFPSHKELNFFHVKGHENKRQILKYWKFLPTNELSYLGYYYNKQPNQLSGESCPSYLYYFKDTIENIKKIHPLKEKVKIVIILREPISKIWSHYKFVKMNKLDEDNLSFKESMKAEAKRLERNDCLPDLFYVDNTMYAESVKAYLEAFDDVLVLLYDDLKLNSQGVLDSICTFLKIDNIQPKNLDVKFNESGKVYLPKNVLSNYFHKLLPLSTNNVLLKKVSYKLKKITSNEEKLDAMDKVRLAKIFKPEVEKLQEIIQRDLTPWLDQYNSILKEQDEK